MNQKHQQTIYHANANVNLMEENLIKMKKIMFEILLHVVVKMENI